MSSVIGPTSSKECKCSPIKTKKLDFNEQKPSYPASQVKILKKFCLPTKKFSLLWHATTIKTTAFGRQSLPVLLTPFPTVNTLPPWWYGPESAPRAKNPSFLGKNGQNQQRSGPPEDFSRRSVSLGNGSLWQKAMDITTRVRASPQAPKGTGLVLDPFSGFFEHSEWPLYSPNLNPKNSGFSWIL